MPSAPRDDEPPEGTYSLADLQAMDAAGDIDIIAPGTPEADAFDREMVAELDAYNARLLARDGPDALTSDRDLRIAALAAERDPGTIAHALVTARRQLVTDHAGLAAWLGVTPTRLAALAIQPRPDPAAPTFADEVWELAERFGAEPGRLADALG